MVCSSDSSLAETEISVLQLQQALRFVGYNLSVTGKFDAATKSAVKILQILLGLSVDGIPGIKTRGVLDVVARNKKNGWLSIGMIGTDVLKLQNELNKLGFHCGAADGEFGANTYNAVYSFQSAKGLVRDGIAGHATMNAINAALDPIPFEGGLTYNKNGNITGTGASKPIIPFIFNNGARSAANYDTVINQFDVVNNPRYAKRDNNNDGVKETFCNIFAWDVTLAMNAEVPHWVRNDTNEPYIYDTSISYSENTLVAHEMSANSVAVWLNRFGSYYGWTLLTSAKAAQASANLGKPTTGVWRNSGGIGHIVIVRPNLSGDGEVHIAQAGSSNYNDGILSKHSSSRFVNGVVFYTHA